MSLGVFEIQEKYGHEQVMFWRDSDVSLCAILVIHNTLLGPARGGIRMHNNHTSEKAALEEVSDLAMAMTLKAAAVDLARGGGKLIVMCNASVSGDERRRIFLSLGRFIHSLGGLYYGAVDMGTTAEDMKIIREVTKYVNVVDVSQVTAWGVLCGIEEALTFKYGENFNTDTFKIKRERGIWRPVKVLVQGVGKTGYHLTKYLAKRNAQIIISDPRIAKDEELSKNLLLAFKEVESFIALPEEIFHEYEADVFAPCAGPNVINNKTIGYVIKHFDVIAGSANNPIQNATENSRRLKESGVIYAPDFIVNAGGIIGSDYVFQNNLENLDIVPDELLFNVRDKIKMSLRGILKESAENDSLSNHDVAVMNAKKRLREARHY